MYKVMIEQDPDEVKALDAALGIVVTKEGAFSFANGSPKEVIVALYRLMRSVKSVCKEIAEKMKITTADLDALLRSFDEGVQDGSFN